MQVHAYIGRALEHITACVRRFFVLGCVGVCTWPGEPPRRSAIKLGYDDNESLSPGRGISDKDQRPRTHDISQETHYRDKLWRVYTTSPQRLSTPPYNSFMTP